MEVGRSMAPRAERIENSEKVRAYDFRCRVSGVSIAVGQRRSQFDRIRRTQFFGVIYDDI
jgi:hypothetical protein